MSRHSRYSEAKCHNIIDGNEDTNHTHFELITVHNSVTFLLGITSAILVTNLINGL